MAAVPATPPVSYFDILPYELIDIIIKVQAQGSCRGHRGIYSGPCMTGGGGGCPKYIPCGTIQ